MVMPFEKLKWDNEFHQRMEKKDRVLHEGVLNSLLLEHDVKL